MADQTAAYTNYLADLRRNPPAPAPENNNQKVFKCVKEYIEEKSKKYYLNDDNIHYV